MLARIWSGELKTWQRCTALLLIVILALVLARIDHHTRLAYRLNLYPILVVAAVLCFQELGLLAVVGALGLYHFVSLEYHWETRMMLVSNLEQIFTNSLVGVLCLLVVRFYRDRLRHEGEISKARQDTVDYLIHEVRNPLFAARGLLYAATLRADAPQEVAQVKGLLEDVDHLLEQLHDSAREQTVAKPVLGAVDLRPLLGKMTERFASLDSRHSYQFVAPAKPATVMGNAALVCRILENLLGNAMRYSSGGPVVVAVEAAAGGYLITVTDPGPGVSERESRQIFDRHHRGEAGRAGPPGLGVGLYLSRQYAIAQTGRLTVVAGGRGCFELWLPRAESH